MYQKVFDIKKRCLNFASAVTVFSLKLKKKGFYEHANQLIKSSNSIGANLIEAHSAQSKKEFIRIANISLREANETTYWFQLINNIKIISYSETNWLFTESKEIANIIATIIINTKKNLEKKKH